MLTRTCLTVFAVAALGASAVFAQTSAPTTQMAPASQPAAAAIIAAATQPTLATQPTSRPAPRVETPPPGFIRVTAGRYSAFCLPADETWVRQSLTEAKAEHLPSTRPADILANVASQRDTICRGLASDLNLDPDSIGPVLFDQHLVPDLKQIQDVKPPVVFFVVTENKLVDLLQNGWVHPRFAYNKLMNRVKFDDRMVLRSEGQMDEMLSLAEYDSADSVKDRGKKLRDAAEQFESDIAFSLASRARVLVTSNLMSMVQQSVFAQVQTRTDQSWLQIGVMTYEAAKYSPPLTGVSFDQTMADLTYRPEGSEPTVASIDFLDLPDFSQMQPQYRQTYFNAIRAKATMAIVKLIKDGGPTAIGKAITAVKKNPPQDGVSLIALVTGATGVDLYKDLRKQ